MAVAPEVYFHRRPLQLQPVAINVKELLLRLQHLEEEC